MAVQTTNLLLVTNEILVTNSIERTNLILRPVAVLPTLPTPTFSPVAGSYGSAQSVTITSAGATAIYYTTDGSTPTTGSTLYTGAITVSTSETIKALATAVGFTNSAVGSAAYVISLGPVLVASAIAQGPQFGTPATTTGINTTGANFLIAACNNYDSNPAQLTLTDTIGGIASGNAWILCSTVGTMGTSGVPFYFYCYAAHVGVNHVFNLANTGGDGCPNVCAMAFSGMPATGAPEAASSVLGFGGTAGGPVTTGMPQSPATTGDLVIAALGVDGSSFVFSISEGTIVQSSSLYAGTPGIAAAYFTAPNTSAVDPSWTWTGGTAAQGGVSFVIFPG